MIKVIKKIETAIPIGDLTGGTVFEFEGQEFMKLGWEFICNDKKVIAIALNGFDHLFIEASNRFPDFVYQKGSQLTIV